MKEPTKALAMPAFASMTSRYAAVLALLSTAAFAEPLAWRLDLAAGPHTSLTRDLASAPLVLGSAGGGLGVAVAVGETWRQELRLEGGAAAVRGPFAQARGWSAWGSLAWAALPVLVRGERQTLRAGPRLASAAWRQTLDGVLNEHSSWAFGQEFGLDLRLTARLGLTDTLELAAALPLLTWVGRPPYATLDESSRQRASSPFALALADGAAASPGSWLHPSLRLTWAHPLGERTLLAGLSLSWLRVPAPARLDDWSAAAWVGLRFGGGAA